MPKMKTDRGAAKRIKITGTGRLAPAQGVPFPPLEKKAPRARRWARGGHRRGDERQVRRMLGR